MRLISIEIFHTFISTTFNKQIGGIEVLATQKILVKYFDLLYNNAQCNEIDIKNGLYVALLSNEN